jgi:hypothetical protein
VKRFYFEVKRSEVSYGEVIGDKVTMCINRVPYTEGNFIVTISFGCSLYCGCFNLFCNVWVCLCVEFVTCGCFGNMRTCIYCVLYCLNWVFVLFSLCMFIRISFTIIIIS